MFNVGNLDRIIRVVLGLALVLVPALAGWALWSGIAGAIGAVLLVTAVVGVCPIYALFGLSSKRRDAQ